MVELRNPETGACHKTPVHLDRLKMAYVREPQPTPYFLNKVVTNDNGQQVDKRGDSQNVHTDRTGIKGVQTNEASPTDEQTVDYTVHLPRRSTRTSIS